MNEAVTAISAATGQPEFLSLTPEAPQLGASETFGATIDRELGRVNGQLLGAERSMQDLAAGKSTSLHQSMIDIEQARLSIQLLMQLRTRALESYQELMRMQI